MVPAFALAAALVRRVTMVYYNLLVAGLFVLPGALGYACFRATARAAPLPAQAA